MRGPTCKNAAVSIIFTARGTFKPEFDSSRFKEHEFFPNSGGNNVDHAITYIAHLFSPECLSKSFCKYFVEACNAMAVNLLFDHLEGRRTEDFFVDWILEEDARSYPRPPQARAREMANRILRMNCDD
ncbi:hypothetical protein CC78DRAFT_586622 [Lojkania enalia]|uniref:Uncharacterized protein n=1 Tax=Lojkania enalia TaxID=147567 RepID=A0A9P4N1L1_9PLEO|nr:hypothetical protein CC78DRAFT_586622 [Didymosphaeria enalia]